MAAEVMHLVLVQGGVQAENVAWRATQGQHLCQEMARGKLPSQEMARENLLRLEELLSQQNILGLGVRQQSPHPPNLISSSSYHS